MYAEGDTSCQGCQEKSAESPVRKEVDDEEKSEESELDDGYDPVAAEAGDSSDEPVK